MLLFLPVILNLLHLLPAGAVNSLIIDTSSGPATGFINRTTPHVAQFLGIPFAEPPVGERRWLPPILKYREYSINATAFGPSCPQFAGAAPSTWSTDAPEFIIPNGTTGEDRLSVNVWTPWTNGTSSVPLPVIAWIYGGAFQTGGGSVPYQNPSPWIERTQRHVVVSINYRLNIFGFPNAAGLNPDEQNLGLLDQRLALEWIRLNIASFGGDLARITLWGQSAGAMSVDYYNFAYPSDPIIHALIMDSGNALLTLSGSDPQHSNFSFVAHHFNCSSARAAEELACMRAVSAADIEAFLKQRSDAGTAPALSFNPVVDNRTKFANYTARALERNYTLKPALTGTTANEGAPFQPYNRTYGPNMTLANATTLNLFLCPTVQTTRNRYASGALTFRYLYAGNFSNIAPLWWEGAYHSSELPLVFGTAGIARGEETLFERRTSERMQDLWLAFAENPVGGLPEMGWEAYEPGGKAVLLGYRGVASQGIAEERLVEPCEGVMEKPGAVPPP